MSDRIKRALFILMRLYHNQAGNTLAIVAAAMIPLAAMIGGGVDISRLYITKTRLQQACDAGALAGRRAMTGLTWTTTGSGNTKDVAENFFKINFPANKYGTNSAGVAYSASNTGAVTGNASAVVPMTLMSLFNMPARTIAVTCTADLQLPNTDIMFVLDTTGSMTKTNPGDSANRITALRQAVIDFYNVLEAAKVSGTQVRYGFVPYSNTVNVGMLLKSEWLANTAMYQSRVFVTQNTVPTGTANANRTVYTNWTPDTFTTTILAGDPENCMAPSNTLVTSGSPPSAWSPNGSDVPRSRTNYRTLNGSSYSAASQSNGTCKITQKTYNNVAQTRTETYEVNPNGGTPQYTTNNYWNYQPVTYDVSTLKPPAGGTITAYINNPASPAAGQPSTATAGAPQTITWNANSACIEERKTLRPNEVGTAYDMDVDSVPVPGNPDTQWRPWLPRLVYARNVSNYGSTTDPSTWAWNYAATLSTTASYVNMSNYPNDRAACPSPARKLKSKEDGLTLAVLTSYLNGLKTIGDTYHDIGFLWGLRLTSAEGIFSNENRTASNGYNIARNIIFMTDGATETHIQDYDAYGLSALDRRRTATASLPDDVTQDSIVEDRLQKYCTVAKGKGITVWVIAFGTDLTSTLTSCASPGRAYQADDSSQLNETFSKIASQIAQLRVTQ
jgi:Flp pilus assembly protein TadG